MIISEKFTCMRDGLAIRGTMFTNVKPTEMTKPLPVAVVSHGFMANQRSVKAYAEHLAEMGYAAFTFDFCGGCLRGTSDGRTTSMSVLTEKEDLKAVVNYAGSLLFTDQNSLLLMGCSQGGFVSALAAEELHAQKLILFYPALCIPDDARRGSMMFARFDPSAVPETFKCGPMRLGRIYPEDVMDMDPYREISDYTGDVLIVHGADDRIVNASYAEQAYETYRHAKKDRIVSLHILRYADHGFRKDEDRNALYAVDRFIEGKQEVLTADIELTDKILRKTGRVTAELTMPFRGTAESPLFKGVINPGASLVQDTKRGKAVRSTMDFFAQGQDCSGRNCEIHAVCTADKDGKWKAVLTADSEALSFLKETVCEANAEYERKGMQMRIYASAQDCRQVTEKSA